MLSDASAVMIGRQVTEPRGVSCKLTLWSPKAAFFCCLGILAASVFDKMKRFTVLFFSAAALLVTAVPTSFRHQKDQMLRVAFKNGVKSEKTACDKEKKKCEEHCQTRLVSMPNYLTKMSHYVSAHNSCKAACVTIHGHCTECAGRSDDEYDIASRATKRCGYTDANGKVNANKICSTLCSDDHPCGVSMKCWSGLTTNGCGGEPIRNKNCVARAYARNYNYDICNDQCVSQSLQYHGPDYCTYKQHELCMLLKEDGAACVERKWKDLHHDCAECVAMHAFMTEDYSLKDKYHKCRLEQCAYWTENVVSTLCYRQAAQYDYDYTFHGGEGITAVLSK